MVRNKPRKHLFLFTFANCVISYRVVKMNKNTLLKLILIVLLLSNFVVICSIKSPFSNNSTSEIVDSFGVFGINQVRVNSGHEFELVLEDLGVFKCPFCPGKMVV